MYNTISDKKHDALISVIIPCYNAAATVKTSLQSLENQTYKDFEILIINDGSNDSTDMVIRNYMENTNLNIQYIQQKNSGVSSARNTGILNSSGKYIVFLDADDVYHRDYIRAMYSAISKNSADVAYCFFTRRIDSIIDVDEVVEDSEMQNLTQVQIMHDFMYKKGKIGFYNFIYRLELLKKYNICFTPDTKYGEDLEFAWKYLSHCINGIRIDKKLYGYYKNPTSAVNTVSWRKTDLLFALQRTADYLEKKNCESYYLFKSYMYSRAMWAVAKTFARGKRKDLYNRLLVEYDVKTCMKVLARQASNKLVRLSSFIYCINPNLYYFIISLF